MFVLDNVLPSPLQGQDISKSEIWNKNIGFEKRKNYLILASSGRGKSTLLHILYRLRNDYTGTVRYEDKNLQDFSHEEWASVRQTKVSIVFQDLRLFLPITVRENLILKNSLTNIHTEQKIERMAERLGIKNLYDKPCHTLSYGQRQRVAIIRALCQPFDYLLLDEPFSHLDDKNIELATELILEETATQNSGILLVSLGETYKLNYHKVVNL